MNYYPCMNAKFRSKRFDCYMNEHQDITTEEAQRYVSHMIWNEWKRLNQEIITPMDRTDITI